MNPNESTDDSVIGETKEETGVTIGSHNIEQLHTFSTPNHDPRGWVVTVSYLAFIGEEPLIAGDDANEVRWFNMERRGNQLLSNLWRCGNHFRFENRPFFRHDSTLAFDHSKIILKAFNRWLINEHEPLVLQVLGDNFTITEARKFSLSSGASIFAHRSFQLQKAMLQYFDEIGERPLGIGRPSRFTV